MRTRVLALLLATAVAALAVSGAASPAKVRIYTGVPGSPDFNWGTTGPQSPTDAWQQHSLMPQMMMDLCCASNGTDVFVVSGYPAGAPGLFKHAVGGTNWTTLAPPPLQVSNGGCAIVGDTLYYCSGYDLVGSVTIDTLQKYCISTNSWTTAPGPFTGTTYNWQPLVIALGGKVYYISGCNLPGAAAPTREVYAYTPGAGWARVADMNTGSVFAAGWVHGGKIYVAGGASDNGITRTEFYDPGSNTWTVDNVAFPQLPYAVWGAGSGVVGNTGFIASGVDAGWGLVDSVMKFDHVTQTWTVEEPVFLRVYRTCAWGNPDGKAVLYGGSTGGFSPTNVCQYDELPVGGPMRVLWLYSDYQQPDTTLGWRLTALGDSVEYLDVRYSTPALGDLLPYDAVGVHTNYRPFDSIGLGNVLADYVDAGGGVVIGQFALCHDWGITGRIFTGDYAAINKGANTQSATTLGWYNPAHPVMAGVASSGEYFAASGTFNSAAESVARWADGRPYVGISANGKVAGVNTYPGVYPNPNRTGDWALVIHNALGFVAGHGVGVREFDPLAPALGVTLTAGPNPARGRARIGYAAPGGAPVDVAVYDLNGRLVRTLVRAGSGSDVHTVTWNLDDAQGRPVPAGVYFCQLVAGSRTVSRKLVVR